MALKNLLLVEGKDDENVIKHLCGNRKLGTIDDIREKGGVDNIISSLPTYIKGSDIKAIGIIVDADTGLDKIWKSIISILERAGYTRLPVHPKPEGTIIISAKDILPKIGIWIMPDNKTPGILEDFLKLLVPPSNKLFTYTEKCVNGIAPEDQLFENKDRPKALIHTWLAWQEVPGRALGTSITCKYLNPNSPHANNLSEWLSELFFK